MNEMDSDGDGYMSQDEFVTNWNNENPDAPIDSDQSFLTTEDVEDLIELCDYDAPSDLIDINEMQCFIDNLVGMMPDDENTRVWTTFSVTLIPMATGISRQLNS